MRKIVIPSSNNDDVFNIGRILLCHHLGLYQTSLSLGRRYAELHFYVAEKPIDGFGFYKHNPCHWVVDVHESNLTPSERTEKALALYKEILTKLGWELPKMDVSNENGEHFFTYKP